jgi:hypothetical protein
MLERAGLINPEIKLSTYRLYRKETFPDRLKPQAGRKKPDMKFHREFSLEMTTP